MCEIAVRRLRAARLGAIARACVHAAPRAPSARLDGACLPAGPARRATLECDAGTDISLLVPRAIVPPLRRPSAARAALPVLALVALLGCTDRGWLAPPTLEPLLVHSDGTWLLDTKRRIVLLRGVNVSSLERGASPPAHELREDDFAWLAALGFNLIRLPVPWLAVEPRPNVFDFGYMRDRIDPLLRLASNNGMQVVLALYPVRWSSCVASGSVPPPWVCGASDDVRPVEPGWGPVDALAELRAMRAQCSFFQGAAAADGRALRDHFVDAWQALATYYDQDKRIVAFDLLNEPSALTCAPIASFVTDVLGPYYGELRDVVRAAGAPQALLYQPALLRDDPLAGVPPVPGGDAIFGPHLYSQKFGPPPGSRDDGATFAAALERAHGLARDVGGPLLLGEIGGNGAPVDGERPVTRPFLEMSLAELDQHLIGGAVWAYTGQGAGRPASGGIGIGNEEDARVLARPFARRIAGVPVEMRFDPASRAFAFTFRDDPERAAPDPSEIFLPAERVYPGGFDVELTRGDRWVFDEHNQRLLLYRGTADVHTMRVTPRAGDAAVAR